MIVGETIIWQAYGSILKKDGTKGEQRGEWWSNRK